MTPTTDLDLQLVEVLQRNQLSLTYSNNGRRESDKELGYFNRVKAFYEMSHV